MHSHRSSSTAVPITIVTEDGGLLIPSNPVEMWMQIHYLQLKCNLLEKEVLDTRANWAMSEAHCTIMKWAALDLMSQVEQQKCKSCHPVKMKAHLVACPGSAAHEAEFAARQ
jgi:hypothetical protein